MSPIGLVSLLTVLLHYEFLVLLIVIDFDLVFHVLWSEQQKMVSIEEIIEIQKREEVAQKATAKKQHQLAKKANQVPSNAKGPSSVNQGGKGDYH